MAYLQREEILQALTPRERDVVERIASGLEIKEIARELRIGYHTVKMHIRSAKGKLGARNQLEIAILMHGGQPRTMPAPGEHPLRRSEHVERDPIWRGQLRFSPSRR
jgi:DNA-binding CsgD family transcriptional regulator